jgi:hypothetical protein
VLGYNEKEVWRMTIKKILLLIREHRKYKGIENKETTIDDVIPF